MYDLNIMPAENKRTLHDIAVTRTVVRISIRLWILIVLLVLFLFGTQQYFNDRIQSEQKMLDGIKITKNDGQLPINDIIRTINSETLLISPYTRERTMDTILVSIASAIPTDITITNLSYIAKTNELSITGIAETRKDLPIFEQSMAALPILTSVSVTSSISDREKIPVSLNAQVTPAGTNKQ